MLALIHLGALLFLAGLILILLSSKRSPLPSDWIRLNLHFENGLFLAAFGTLLVMVFAVFSTILRGLALLISIAGMASGSAA